MPKAEKYGVNQFEPAHEGKLGEIDSSYNIFWAKKKLNTRVLHSRDLQKVAAFSISQRGFDLLRRLDALFTERAQEQHMMR